ncbi:MAG: DUF5706 domain-containing protein [Saprospiraceae bacterium]|nr:DUF5706 domain-containing protein [Saprospiraceae bacterium]
MNDTLTNEPHPIQEQLQQLQQQLIALWRVEASAEQLFHTPKMFDKWTRLVREIGEAESLPETDIELLELAIQCLAFGHLRKNHEAALEKARELSDQNLLTAEQTAQLVALILFVHSDQKPTDLPQGVLFDAIWAYTGKNNFDRDANLLRIELEYFGETMEEEAWGQYLLQQLIQHPFYTNYAVEQFGKKRRGYIADLRSKMKKSQITDQKDRTGKNLGRGIDTLFRVNFRNHINISNIADGKANIMISINTILLSIMITLGSTGLFLELPSSDKLVNYLPLFCLMGTCVVSLIFSVLATRPKMTNKSIKLEKGANLLFFNNFLKVSQAEFIDYIQELKHDQEQLYKDMGKDLYSLGSVLQKKYRLLTLAYNSFLIGILVTVASFIIRHLF